MSLHRLELQPQAPGLDRTMILLHGFGADEHDLLPLAHEMDPRLRVISLRGPIELDFGGRAWFNLRQTPKGFEFDLAEVREAVRLAREDIEEIARSSPRPLLCGFSQGGGIGLSVALEQPDLVSGVLALSPVPPRAQPSTSPSLRNLQIFAAHGTEDPLLPIAMGRKTRDYLQKQGVAVTWREYPMGHMVVVQEIADAREWLARLLATPVGPR
jgi:phospholipase/carboxylesterase